MCTYNKHKACERMHRLYLFLLVAALTCCNNAVSYGQNRFNYNYPFQNYTNQSATVLQINDGYLVFEQIENTDSVNTGLGVRKIDLTGTQLWVKNIFKPRTITYGGASDCAHIISTNKIIISGSFIDTVYTAIPCDGYLGCINFEGDTLWTKNFGGPWQDVFKGSLLDNQGNIISVGWNHTSASNYDAWALKTDTLGNIIWDKKFGGINGDIFSSVLQAPDGGYYLIGGSNSYNSQSDVYLVKVSVDGNLEWQKSFLSPLADGANGAIISNNKIYIAGASFTNYPTSQFTDGLFLICELDGTLITSKILGGATLSNSFRTKTLALNDGSIVVAGESRTQQNPNVPWGWLFKFNQDGDSIWARTYFNNPNAPNYIYDLKATSDGGFIMAGSTHDSLGGIGAQNSWVLKVDEYGCEVENCQLYDAVEDVAVNNIYFSASPNPFSDQTTINYTLVENTKAELMVIEMATGKIIKRATVLADASQTYTLSNEGLSPGVYAIQMFINAQLINAIKVVYIQ